MEQKYFGFWGRILRVDLTTGKCVTEEPDPSVYRLYIGGRTLALYYLLREMPAGVDPLGPENRLVFTTSPATGCPISGQGRHTVAALSPLTGGLLDSQGGGRWGAELKFAGWDGIVVEGKSDMKKRGLRSPDLADAFLLTFAGHDRRRTQRYNRPTPRMELAWAA